MHNSALESFNNFKNIYLSKLSNKKFKLIEIGSLSVNSNIKKDNTALFSKLHLVDWKMDVLCPAEGASAIVNLIG